MRPGPLEIILIIAVIIAVVVIVRIIRSGRGTAHNRESPVEKTTGPRRIVSRTGIALMLTGVVLLLAGLSMFRWAFQMYLWAFVIIAIGGITLFLSRKKR